MKKLFVGVVLPILAAAAVVGSGFSVWNLGTTQDAASGNATGNVIVTPQAGADAYEVQGPWNSTDPTKNNKLNIGFDQAGTGNGPYWATTDLDANEEPVKLPTEAKVTVSAKAGAQPITVVRTEIGFPESIARYVKLNNSASGNNIPGANAGYVTYIYNWTISTNTTAVTSVEWDLQTAALEYVNPITTQEAYTNMKNAVESEKNLITIKVIVNNK